jgi:tetratricopeptide (TPR) repeat protein
MVTRHITLLISLLVVIGLRQLRQESSGALAPPQVNASREQVPLFDGLGTHGRKTTTSNEQAQRYFNQGLCFLFAFNHDEAIRSFWQAAELDPQLAMAWWGIALANGPHINNPIVDEARAKAAFQALTKARGAAAGASAVERELIEALGKRYSDPQPEDRSPLDRAYAGEMRQVWKSNPGDADIGALFAESLMNLRPWDLWTPDGDPQPGTEEVVATLEAVLNFAPNHPLALHLYIHAVEASPQPEKADDEADRLRDLQPGLGHLVHMPSHIDVRRGRWREAAEANRKAIEADRKYRQQSPGQNFYRVYMAHNYHMLAYAAIMQGQSEQAIAAIRDMVAAMPQDWVKENAALADGFTAMPLEVLVRFGKWDEILQAPEPPDYLPIARAMRRYARGVAYAAKGQVNEAKAEQQAVRLATQNLPATAQFGNNTAADLLGVAEHLLDGEVLYRAGKVADAIDLLHEAVRREDQLRYDEPPDWIHPVRHVLGATLLQEGRFDEAEQVYREDLRRLPENGWSLFGLSRVLELKGKQAEAAEIKTRFASIWQHADTRLSSSCFCLPGK